MGRCWAVGVVLMIWFTACGGARSLGDGPGDEDPDELGSTPSRDPGERPAPGGKSDGSPGREPFSFGEGAPLRECVAGFRPRDKPDKPCNCLVEGVCFDDKAQACACICPRTGKQNACVSEHDCELNSRTKVSCYSI